MIVKHPLKLFLMSKPSGLGTHSLQFSIWAQKANRGICGSCILALEKGLTQIKWYSHFAYKCEHIYFYIFKSTNSQSKVLY